MSQGDDAEDFYDVMASELAAISRLLDHIEAMPGSAAKTAAIREAAIRLSELEARASKMREAEVIRLRDEGLLALAPLADQLGISKARAGQISKAEKDRRQKEASDV